MCVVAVTKGGVGHKAGLEYGDKIKIGVECKKTGDRKYLKAESYNLELYKDRLKHHLKDAKKNNSTIILMIQRSKKY